MNETTSFVGITALLSCVLSVGAAVMAINLYALLRTGRIGASWRVLIIASVMFALLQAVRLAELLDVSVAAQLHLSSVVELAFAVTLLYAFYLQRQVFSSERRSDDNDDEETLEDESDTEDASSSKDAAVVSSYRRYS